MTAELPFVLADHGDLRVSLAFFGPVALMLVALAVVTVVQQRRYRAGEDGTTSCVEVESDPDA